jgi:hypothetical protein
MLSASANQGLVAVVLRFISRAILTFHSADLAAALQGALYLPCIWT